MKRYVQQQLLSYHDECPFFEVAHPSRAAGGGMAVASATLPEALNRRLFSMASASPLHRLALFSACLRHLAFLHGRQSEGCMSWVVGTAEMLGGQGGAAALTANAFVVPRAWRLSEEDLHRQVKSLFGSELAQWKQLQSLLTGKSAAEIALLTPPPLNVLVAYSEVGTPLAGVDAAACAVVLVIRAAPDQTDVEVRCATGHGDAGPAARLVERLQTLLAALVDAPNAPLASVSMLAGAERALVLQHFNATDAPFPEQALLHALIEAQVQRSPAALAVVSGDQVLSYAALNARANQLARWLRTQPGIVPDARIAVCMERSAEMVVALLAVLKAGGAYVPLDPHLPAERVAYMLEDAAPCAVLTHAAVGGAVREVLARQVLLHLDADAARWCELAADDLDPAAIGLTSAHLAYVIYTSGSTGRPKGVMNEHRGIVNLLAWAQKTYPLDGNDAVLQKTPFGFDVSLLEFFWPLLVGARLVMARPEGHKDPGYLSALIDAQGITTLHFVPSMLSMFLEQAPAGTGAALRRVFCSGEALPAHSVHRFLERFPQVELHNLYGPTEAAVEVTAWDCARGPRPSSQGGVVPIGRPIDNLRIYILDAQGEPTPVGVAGELHIAGVGVARGYLNKPELTAEKFLLDRFDPRPGQRMYRSGDLARYLPDGNLEYLGRNDLQVKLRGFRIELGEIETVLAACPGVREAVVVARTDASGETSLIAYVVGDGRAELSAATLRPQLARVLAEYMLPATYVVLEALPLSANGKLDRRALPAPQAAGVSGRAHEPPQGPLEPRLAQLWCDALGVERVGRGDHFFELGGHSLRAVRMLAAIEKEFGQVVPLLAFFNNDTLAALAAMLRGDQGIDATAARGAAPAHAALVRLSREQPLPASLSQRRLWFLDQLDPAAGRAYHVPIALRLSGPLDRAALKAALDAAVARHESLRTRFVVLQEMPHLVFESAAAGFQLIERDLTGLGGGEQELAIAQQLAEEFEGRFDLATGPLIRGRLLRLATDEHALLITQHHISTDGWSLQVLAREVSALYAALLDGRADPLPPLAFQYADYAAWQDGWLRGEPLQQGVEFWRSHLDGAPALLELPSDRLRPKRQTYAGASVPLEFPPILAARLRKLGQQHGCTVFMVFLAGWSALLSRLSGQGEVVVGTPVANRRGGMEDAIGLFVNTLALRIRPADMPSGTALLQQVRAVTLAAFEHQHVPFDQVVEALRPQRSLGYSPLFQTTLSVDTVIDGEGVALPGLTLQPLTADWATTHFDISLAVVDDGAQMSGSIEFALDLFDRSTVERWGGHLLRLLAAMADDPDCRPDDLPLLTSQQHGLLARFNDTRVALPGPALVHEHFEAQVRRSPDAVAVVFGTHALTYTQLNGRANRLAHLLISKGVAADRRVAICVERSLDMVIGLLAILKAGGAYVPLDAAYPDDRLRFMLADSAPLVLLLQASLIERFESLAAHEVLRVSFDDAVLGAMTDADPQPVVAGSSLAYVIYTSGSTGRPKGVMVEHRGLLNYLQWAADHYTIPAGGCSLVISSLSFDATVTGLYVPLLSGRMVRLVPEGAEHESLEQWLRRDAACLVKISPAHLRALGEQWAGELTAACCFVVGGEALPLSTVELWQRLAPQVRLVNEYGPTETVVGCSSYEIPRSGALGTSVPIGRPIANTQIYVLDSRQQQVPIGVTGEIHIGGAGVARGYLNRPELTTERFIKDPFSSAVDARLYKSGDLGRWRADGTLEYLGRNDHQVKLRGFRIELGEIEARLSEREGVSAAVVLAHEVAGEQRLVAYVVGTAVAPSADELRAALQRQLPQYMVPKAFVRLAVLPLTPNGKVDRAALPTPDGGAYARGEYQAPQGEVEQALAEIWQSLLGVERVGRHDDFFALGGHSLLAIQLLARVRVRLGCELALREVFEQPTLAQLSQRSRAVSTKALAPIVPAPRTESMVLSLSQQRLWFIDQLEGNTQAYHITVGLSLHGVLDVNALQRALDTLIERHEVLRTRFEQQRGAAVQVIVSRAAFELRQLDLSDHGAAQRASRLRQIGEAVAAERFDLSRAPLIRGCLVKLSSVEQVLWVTMHHIVADGWSIGILLQEVGALYAAYAAGTSNPLPALPIQYADYAVWQRHWLQGEVLERQLAYWRQQLSAIPALLELPTDRPRPGVQSYRGGSVGIELGRELSQRLGQLSRQQGTTSFMTLYTGFAVLLSKLSGQEDLVIGVSVANRHRTELEGLIGFFVNNLALRARVYGTSSVAALLAQVREMTLGAYDHQDLPFERVVQALQPVRSLSHTPIFQVLFALQNTPLREVRLPQLELQGVPHEVSTTQFDLMLTLQESTGGEIVGGFTYASDLFDRATIERWAGHYRRVLEEMVRDASQPLSGLSLLTEAQCRQMVAGLNQTRIEYPSERLVHELFEAQVSRTPDAIALVHEHEQLTYRILNERANQVAHYLRSLGVGAEVLVALCVERSVEMVVGLLGILKAGGAYVPLDPRYPLARLEYLLADAAAPILLTQAKYQDHLPAGATQLITLDEDWQRFARQPVDDPPRQETGLEHLAYVIYTSGSTGLPKGVMVQHRGLLNYLQWAGDSYTLPAGGGSAVISALSFDATVTGLYVPLLSGRTVRLVREGAEYEGLAQWLQREDACDLVKISPAHLRALGEQWQGEFTAACCFVVGGEALPVSTVELWRRLAPQVRLVNEYGPTETVVGCSSYEIPRSGELGTSVPIGRPIANTQIYVLDRHGLPAPIGVSGEIYIGGAGVARGYLQREELTAERFVLDPFSIDPQARMYRTGDLARWRADGTLEYLGRNDQQVKLRGFRIELGEIEAQLSQQAGVSEAVVLAREVGGEMRLVAYVVGTVAAPRADELRAALKRQLPEYMVPSAFVMLTALPLTPNGKVDRAALPAPGGGAYARGEDQAPQGEVEQVLAQIWQALLGIERVGRHDNFFELGGHSLLVVQLIGQLRQAGWSTQLRSVFTSPTLQALARDLTRDAGGAHFAAPANLIAAGCESITPSMLPLLELTQAEIDSIVATVPGGAGNVQDIYPLAPLQEGILFHHLLDARHDAYVTPMLLRVQTRSKLAGLLAALEQVIARHDILRSAVLWEGLSRPVQVVYRRAELQVEELQLLAGEDEVEQLRARMSPEGLRMELSRAPLLRLQVAKAVHGQAWYVLLRHHHVVSDHIALDLVLLEVEAYLRGTQQGLPPPMAYREFVAQALAGGEERRAREEAFFRSKLGDVVETTAPYGLADVHGDGSEIEEARADLDAGVNARVREAARELNVGAATLFHAAWALVLSRVSGRDDVVFGSVLLGRLQGMKGSERVLGMFINTLPLRIRLPGLSARDLVRSTHEELVQLLEHEQASLALAQRCSGLGGGGPLFSALFNYRHSERAEPQPGRDAQDSGIETVWMQERTNYPLTLSVDDYGDGFGLDAQTDRRIDPQRVLEYMECALASLLMALQRTPAVAALELEVVPARERRQVLEGFNQTRAEPPDARLMRESFEAQVLRTPDATAVVHAQQQLTYRTLNERANQVAHRLLSLGVRPDDRVVICVQRSVEMAIGVLAVIKAGAAFVPLDPDQPDERLAFMLEDCAPVAVLTQRAVLLRQRFEQPHLPTIVLEEGHAHAALDDPRIPAPLGSHLAYVIYTSGSTGRPKGVMVHHAALMNYLHHARDAYMLGHLQGGLVATPFGFDASLTTLLTPWLVGKTTVLLCDDKQMSLEELLRYCRSASAWLFKLTPAHLEALTELSGPMPAPTRHVMVVGGEQLTCRNVERFRRQVAARALLFNEYGPTETVVGCSVQCIDGERLPETDAVPIGRPIRNTRMYVLDAHGNPAPLGVAGEIHIAGAGVARGYLGRPALTAERFLDDSFDNERGGRRYRTGDLGRWLPDGTIQYLGRNDSQVKLRGYRVEMGEIEASLAACDGVREAVVLAREAIAGDRQLVAYVVAQAGAELSSTALQQQLSRRLADYMLPQAYVLLAALPLTVNGKLDRGALPAPQLAAAAQAGAQPPQGMMELALARIWAALLGRERIDRDAGFFELGGHSLLAVRLMARIRDELGIELPIRQLFATPRLKDLAAFLETGRSRGAFPNLVPIRPAGSRPPLFLVHPGEGEIGYARVLSRWLDVQIPIYGFAAAGFMPGEQPHATIEAMASCYLLGMRSVQPTGPYRIAGWSLGGTIAYEMVAQLLAGGERVQFLGLIDTLPGHGPVRVLDPLESTRRRDALYLLETLAAAVSPATRGLLEMHARASDVAAMVEVGRRQALLPADLDTPTLCRHVSVRAALLAAVRAYVPRYLPIEACLFTAAESEDLDCCGGWRDITANLGHIKVPGTHYSMVEEPNARLLAAAMGRQILEMEQRGAACGSARTCEEQRA